MKRTLIVISSLLAVGTLAAVAVAEVAQTPLTQAPLGQNGGEGGKCGGRFMKMRGMIQKGMARVAERLGLSDEQKAQMKDIFTAMRGELSELRQTEGLTDEARRERARTIIETYKDQARNVLTAEQQAEWDKIRAEREARRAARGAGGETPGLGRRGEP